MNPASTDGMIATAAGESQTTTFHDGGGVSVKPNSRVLLDAYESERRVELLKGEAVFTATPVPNRPLVVSTYIARASAVDATFRVALDGGMLVEVYDGQVDVAVPGRSAITLRKGNRYRVIEELSDSVVAQERGQEQEVVLGSMTRAKS
jgi:transmembrane sensor